MKRFFDAVTATVLFVTLSPVMIIVAVAVLVDLGRPVLFCQERPGLHGRSFGLLKFRTMKAAHDQDGQLLSDAARLTPLGKLLRSLSLDELPGLWNVVRGEMSLVGPRPLLPSYLPLYTARQSRRHEVLPGITGWAQVNGRNAIDWERKLELDVWYVDNRSFWLDLQILMLTVVKVLRREHVAAPGEATVTAFRGSEATAKTSQCGIREANNGK